MNKKSYNLKSGSSVLDCSFPQIMGILNVTPDSFSDGGRWMNPADAYRHAESMVEQGASIIDVGAESSRPEAMPVSLQQELDRLGPILEQVCQLPVWISIDSYKLEVMQIAWSLGAKLFNDITGFRNRESLQWAAQAEVAICVMHMKGTPATMARDPFDSFVACYHVVHDFFEHLLFDARQLGIDYDHICLDPGFGFGKTKAQNYRMLRQLPQLLDFPCISLVGLSNKSMLSLPILKSTLHQQTHLAACNALTTFYAALQGCSIIRVHDVALASSSLHFYRQLQEA